MIKFDTAFDKYLEKLQLSSQQLEKFRKMSLSKKGKIRNLEKLRPMGALLTYVYTLRTEDRMMALIEYI